MIASDFFSMGARLHIRNKTRLKGDEVRKDESRKKEITGALIAVRIVSVFMHLFSAGNLRNPPLCVPLPHKKA